MTASLHQRITELLAGGRAREGVPLAELTTWRIGGPAELVVEPGHLDCLPDLLALAAGEGLSLQVLGNGSNLLAPDAGVAGLLVRLAGCLQAVEFQGETIVAEAGAFLPKLARDAAARGLSGLECVVGVPGTVGGGLVMNAGVPAGTLGERLAWAEVLWPDGRVERLGRADLAFGHRQSRLQHDAGTVLRAALRLEPDDPRRIASRMDEHMTHRRRTQPLHLPSAGSVFRRHEAGAVGALLEAAGCKGLRRGGAEVSTLHANWIVNRGGATAAEVRWLMVEMDRRVRESHGVELQREVVVWQEGDTSG